VVRSEVIRRRLNKLDEYIDLLAAFQRYSLEGFLLLAIEAVLDMENHLIADEGLGVVNWYSDIPSKSPRSLRAYFAFSHQQS
jgi:uncharacterized protein YutE (UPF0331/DUF86 family)